VIAIVLAVVLSSGGGSGTTTAGGADCGDKTADSKGMTPCMRKLAGSVPSNSSCQSGVVMPNGSGQPINTPGAASATCKIDSDYTVLYYQFGSTNDVNAYIDGLFSALNKKRSDAETGSWSGGGLSGTTYTVDFGMGIGAVVFTMEGQPLVGTLLKLTTTSADQSLSDYFAAHVKPGAGGA
jgi:hypothetical protein